mgnify:CR=1 FL=1
MNADGFGDPANNESITSLAVYGGRLYAGTYHGAGGGCEVWRTSATGGPPYTDWAQVNSDGFGDPGNRGALSMIPFGDLLMVGTENVATGCEVWAYDGSTWREAASGGFGDGHNEAATCMLAHGNRLFVGTHNDLGAGGNDLAQIDRFFFRSGGSSSSPEKLVADELRVGLSWAAVTTPLRPALRAEREGAAIRLRWTTNAPGFGLESTDALPPGEWSPVQAGIGLEGADFTASVPTTNAKRFFRLRR